MHFQGKKKKFPYCGDRIQSLAITVSSFWLSAALESTFPWRRVQYYQWSARFNCMQSALIFIVVPVSDWRVLKYMRIWSNQDISEHIVLWAKISSCCITANEITLIAHREFWDKLPRNRRSELCEITARLACVDSVHTHTREPRSLHCEYKIRATEVKQDIPVFSDRFQIRSRAYSILNLWPCDEHKGLIIRSLREISSLSRNKWWQQCTHLSKSWAKQRQLHVRILMWYFSQSICFPTLVINQKNWTNLVL